MIGSRIAPMASESSGVALWDQIESEKGQVAIDKQDRDTQSGRTDPGKSALGRPQYWPCRRRCYPSLYDLKFCTLTHRWL